MDQSGGSAGRVSLSHDRHIDVVHTLRTTQEGLLWLTRDRQRVAKGERYRESGFALVVTTGEPPRFQTDAPAKLRYAKQQTMWISAALRFRTAPC